jgi:hypothetical protein
MHINEYIQHPYTTLHLTGRAPKPVKVNDGRVGLNGRIGLLITTLVGTMICGYVFALIALISLPSSAGAFGASGGPAVAPGPAGT